MTKALPVGAFFILYVLKSIVKIAPPFARFGAGVFLVYFWRVPGVFTVAGCLELAGRQPRRDLGFQSARRKDPILLQHPSRMRREDLVFTLFEIFDGVEIKRDARRLDDAACNPSLTGSFLVRL